MLKKQANVKKYLKVGGLWLLILVAFYSLFQFLPLFTRQCSDGFFKDGEGWECSYPIDFFNGYVENILENYYRDKCPKNLGQFNHDFVFHGKERVFSCTLPFSDKGNPCKDSDECKGNCEYIGIFPDSCTEVEKDIYSCPEPVIGTCSEFKEYFYTEVVDGGLHIHKHKFNFFDIIP